MAVGLGVAVGAAVAVKSGADFAAMAFVPGACKVIANGLKVGDTVRADGVLLGTGAVEADLSHALNPSTLQMTPRNKTKVILFGFIRFSLTDHQINSGRIYHFTCKSTLHILCHFHALPVISAAESFFFFAFSSYMRSSA